MNQATRLRNQAEALDAREEMVTVPLSKASLWLLRDLIGLGGFNSFGGVSLINDMVRLNDALGTRESKPHVPHVSHWSKVQAERLKKGAIA